MKSRLFEGVVRHRRHTPAGHQFQYRVFMPYLRLDEIPQVLARSPLWSAGALAPARFKRDDFLGDAAIPLEEAVRQRVAEETGERPQGPIYLLANLRYFGHSINPIACYYCFNRDETRLEYVVAEVTNTPWNERHSYVLPGPGEQRWLRTEFAKQMHVSPFNPMDMQYRWRSSTPDHRLVLHLENWSGEERVFDASMALSARPLTAASMNGILARYPLMTVKVGLGIYWQALRLYMKGMPLYPHPANPMTGVTNE